MTSLSCSMCSPIRAVAAGDLASRWVPCRARPIPNSRPMTCSCRSRAIRSRSASTASSLSAVCVVGALQGQPGLVGEGGQELQLLLVERRGRGTAHRQQHPGQVVIGTQRHRQGRPEFHPQPRGHVERQTGDVPRDVIAEHRARRGAGDRDPAAADQLSVRADADRDGQLTDLVRVGLHVGVGGQRDQRPVRAGQLGRPGGDQRQRGVGVGPGQQLRGDLGGGLQPPLAATGPRRRRGPPDPAGRP